MRKIKFRVWDKVNNSYGYLDCLTISNSAYGYDKNEKFNIMATLSICNQIFYSGGTTRIGTNNFIVQQYIGIDDKNKKEIYEGDIVEFNGERGFIHFCCGAFFIDGAGPMYDYVKSLTPYILEDWVVIGNIYENTHLLDT